MKHLLIVGARGWGREVYDAFLHTSPYVNGEMEVKGFLDSKADVLDGIKGKYPPILCAPEDYEPHEDDLFFIAMGDPHWRKHYAELIESKGGHFHTIICAGAYIVSNASIGEGSFVSGWTTVSDNVILGKHTLLHGFCALGHDSKVADYGTLETFTFLGGGAMVGECSIMHVRSTLIRHKKVGKDASVGVGSVALRNVKDGEHVFGNPAKKIEY